MTADEYIYAAIKVLERALATATDKAMRQRIMSAIEQLKEE